MTASLLVSPKIQFIDGNGVPYDGGKVYTYVAGSTSTTKKTYKDYAMGQENTNPIILDSNGRADIWIKGAYKMVLIDKNDNQIWSVDNIISYSDYDFTGLTASVADLNSTTCISVVVTGAYSVVLGDRGKTILGNAASVPITVTLPTIANIPNKFKICIKKIDFSANAVIIVPNTSELIDDLDSLSLSTYGDFVELLADGSAWRIVAKQLRGDIVEVDGDLTIDLSYDKKTILCNPTTANATITLPTIGAVGKGFELTVKCGALNSGFSVIIKPNSPSTIDGNNSLALIGAYDSYTIKTSSNNWYITNSVTQSAVFKTGWWTYTIDTVAQAGWILYYDGSANPATATATIGDASSEATIRANSDCLALYTKIWSNITYPSGSNSLCPVVGGIGASASADWSAHKAIHLPFINGRIFGSKATGIKLGSYEGERLHALSSDENGVHTHTIGESGAHDINKPLVKKLPLGHYDAIPGSACDFLTVTSDASGKSTGHNTVQPTIYFNIMMKL